MNPLLSSSIDVLRDFFATCGVKRLYQDVSMSCRVGRMMDAMCSFPVESCYLNAICDVVWERTDDHVTHLQLSSKAAADATCVLGANACLGGNMWLRLAPMLSKQTTEFRAASHRKNR